MIKTRHGRGKFTRISQKPLGTIKKQEARIAELEGQVLELKATIARLQKDSRNSSKPPSSDIVKPKSQAPQKNGGAKRKIGGQKGHKKHERTPFPPEQVDRFIDVTLEVCPECGGPLHECAEVVRKQQITPVEKPFIVIEYQCHTYSCPACQTVHTAPGPEESRSGLFSAGLIALAAYLKGRSTYPSGRCGHFFRMLWG